MRLIPIILIISLIGCSSIELSSECSRYAHSKEISTLLGITVKKPISAIETENDCTAHYSVKDTSFDLYYWKYFSDNEFYSAFNHEMIYTLNCEGSLCSELYEFHYIGEPRKLEVTCKEGKIWMNDEGKITEKEIDCKVLKNIGKNNQKTWKCDYNDIMEVNCK